MLTENDISILRELAKKYAGYAALPVQKERMRLWRRLNSGPMERPMVLVDQLPWNELDVDGSLRCRIADPYWRQLEERLRQTIYKWEYMPADMVLNPYIALYVPAARTGWGIETKEERIEARLTESVASHRYINQFESLEDVEKIKMPTITRDVEAEKLVREQADVIFDGIIPWKFCGALLEDCGFRLGPWDWITQWMGVTDIYVLMMDEPDLIHAIMRRMTDGILGLQRQCDEQGLFDAVTNAVHCSHTFCEELPRPGCDTDHAGSQDAWGFGLAQLMTSVSPAAFDEFEVRYMMETFEHMGAVYYGCCDRLDDRMDYVARMPNVRKVSCSPWSDREHFAEVMPDRFVMSNKPTPAVLALDSFDLEQARQDVRRTLAAARRHNKRVEMIMKDVSTLRCDPSRIWAWAKMAVEEAERSV